MSLSAIRDWCVRSARGGALMGLALTLGLGGAQAVGGPVPDYGHDFVVIGDPGNRAVNQAEGRRFFPPYAPEGFSVGRVDYRYRMSRTEVTVGQWLEFVNAYAPYYDGPTNDSEFTSSWIRYDSGTGRYRAIGGTENLAANMGWRYAARYCNWLQNDQAVDQSAFENGVYDASTFGLDSDGNATDDRTRGVDARFWIPDLDEWTKALHWDPAKNNGEGGYWRYPNSSDEPPTAGPPGTGDTNAGTVAFYDVGSYPHALSPWGLLDGSGSLAEMLETGTLDVNYPFRRGSSWAQSVWLDEIDALSTLGPNSDFAGLRLASALPSPGAGLLFVLTPAFMGRRRSRPVSHRHERRTECTGDSLSSWQCSPVRSQAPSPSPSTT